MDGISNVVAMMWHTDGVVGGCGQCRRRHLGDIARRRRCSGWWTRFATSFVVTWHVDGVVVGGGRSLRRRWGDVACRWHGGGL